MRRWRANARGLAEIVGTLMLVVIVVAAATAFSFFVASYQKQVQAEETLNHDRALESLKIIGLSEMPCDIKPKECGTGSSCGICFANVSFTLASLDVNSMGLTNIFLNHLPVVNFTATVRGSVESPCFNEIEVSNMTHGLSPCQPLVVPGYSTVVIKFDLGGCLNGPCNNNGYWALGPGEGPADFAPSAHFNLQAVTQLGNQFSETLSPPVAIISVFYVSGGNSSIPVFDGLNSYQPKGADNSSIDFYNWTIENLSGSTPPDSNCGNDGVGFGGEFECADLSGSYTVSLTITNSDGLTGTASISFKMPP
jgi:flagellin-like protein